MQENVKQTGLIVRDPTPSSYRTGAFTAIIPQTRITSGNWSQYLPISEKQYALTFDTLSCVTFSALNAIEMQVNFLVKENILSTAQLNRLTQLGFMKDGMFNASDRFTAIMSGTTKDGNDFETVWLSIKKYGLLPEGDFPFGGTTFEEYHNKDLITETMKAKALQILDIISVDYEWIFFSQKGNIDTDMTNKIHKALTQAPVQIAIPFPAHHACVMTNIRDNVSYDTFDQYPPYQFTEEWTVPIHFAMKGYITPVLDVDYVFTKDLYLTKTDPEVLELQKFLNKDPTTQVALSGPGSPGNETAYFGPATHVSVVKYQKSHGVSPTSGYVGALTRKVMNGTETVQTKQGGAKIDAWCEATKVHEGWFIPGERPESPRGSLSYRCNNPGNIKYLGQRRAIGRTSGTNFCIFATYDDGYAELKDQLIRACTGKSAYYSPEMTLLDFYAGVKLNGINYPGYAPASDNNVPSAYAAYVAKRLGVNVTIKIKELL